jgi:hypothetical protein
MPGRECYHCSQWVEDNEAHDCWSTTERELTKDLSEDLFDAWERLRETASEFGEQRIYASHRSIMFSTQRVLFLRASEEEIAGGSGSFWARPLKHPLIRKTVPTSKVKVGHLVHVTHRDQVESPITDWLQEAYDVCDRLRKKPVRRRA